MAIGAGISRLYIAGHINILFWIGSALVVCPLFIFAIIARALHKKIAKLKDLYWNLPQLQ